MFGSSNGWWEVLSKERINITEAKEILWDSKVRRDLKRDEEVKEKERRSWVERLEESDKVVYIMEKTFQNIS